MTEGSKGGAVSRGHNSDPRKDTRKRNTKCAASGKIGHWREDAACEKSKKIQGKSQVRPVREDHVSRISRRKFFQKLKGESGATPECKDGTREVGIVGKAEEYHWVSEWYALYEAVVECVHPQVRGLVSARVGRGSKPIHDGLNPSGGHIVSWVEPMVSHDTVDPGTNCETLETNELMSTFKKVALPFTQDLIDANIDQVCGRSQREWTKLHLQHLVLFMTHEGLVTSAESGRATLQMMDGPGKAFGKINGSDWNWARSGEAKASKWTWGERENLPMLVVESEGVTNPCSEEMEVDNKREPEGAQVEEKPRWKQHLGKQAKILTTTAAEVIRQPSERNLRNKAIRG